MAKKALKPGKKLSSAKTLSDFTITKHMDGTSPK